MVAGGTSARDFQEGDLTLKGEGDEPNIIGGYLDKGYIPQEP